MLPHPQTPPLSHQRAAPPQGQVVARKPGSTLRSRWSMLCSTAAPGTYGQIGEPFAQAVPPVSAHELLAGAAQGGLRLAIAIDADGARGRYVGELRDVHIEGDLLCASGEGFELRLPEPAIAQAWIVRRPSRTGLMQTLELFDAAGAPLATFASDTGPCGPERCDWRLLINTLAAQADPCVS